jgi:hypothetical protein
MREYDKPRSLTLGCSVCASERSRVSGAPPGGKQIRHGAIKQLAVGERPAAVDETSLPV